MWLQQQLVTMVTHMQWSASAAYLPVHHHQWLTGTSPCIDKGAWPSSSDCNSSKRPNPLSHHLAKQFYGATATKTPNIKTAKHQSIANLNISYWTPMSEHAILMHHCNESALVVAGQLVSKYNVNLYSAPTPKKQPLMCWTIGRIDLLHPFLYIVQ